MRAKSVQLGRIADRSARIGFVGVGYAGLPLALAFAHAGFAVRGYDRDASRAEAIQAGSLPFAHDEPELADLFAQVLAAGDLTVSGRDSVLAGCQVLIVAVDTPVRPDHTPSDDNLQGAIEAVARHVTKDAMVIVESTVAPGTHDRFVIPVLETRTGLRVGEDVAVVHCPERMRPMRMLRNIRTLSRVIGGDSPDSTEIGMALYRCIVDASLVASDYRTAEVVKTAENFVRDAQIAMANQLAVVCDRNGVDIDVVRSLVNQVWREEPIVLEPGPGVGGHCLPKDPWLLVSRLPADSSRSLVEGARAMNDHMIDHVIYLAERLLRVNGVSLANSTVAILGTAYNADTDDERNSAGLALSDALAARGALVRLHDPIVPGRGTMALETALRGADIALLCVSHAAYRRADPVSLCNETGLRAVLDTRRVWDTAALRAIGVSAAALGRGEIAGEYGAD